MELRLVCSNCGIVFYEYCSCCHCGCREVYMEKRDDCWRCGGTGKEWGYRPDLKDNGERTCLNCLGTGREPTTSNYEDKQFTDLHPDQEKSD